MKRLLAAAIAVSLAGSPVITPAAGSSSPAQQLMSKMRWRNIGPFLAGRVVAVAGVAGNPNVFYMGTVQGGVWKSTDRGLSWTNITDGKIPHIASSIGALAVAPSNPNVIYAGTGEADIRQDFYTGDGVYKTTDAGKTWRDAGLHETRTIAKLVVDPRDLNIVYAASLGHVFKPNAERGIFKTTDGGKTWHKVLYVDADTGAVDLSMAPSQPNVLYAAMWQAERTPWKLTSGGPGSGLYKTVDAGAHWTKISSNPGFARGILGKIGVSVSPGNPQVVYSLVQARDGGLFRSEDAGATWRRVNDDMGLRQRAFYYSAIFADPVNPLVAYAPDVDGVRKTVDGGKTGKLINLPHGDNHVLWIDPRNPTILLEGSDGGATVSFDGGRTWSDVNNQPTGQFYKVAIDDQFPFHVYGAAQDQGAFETVSAAWDGIGPQHLYSVAGSESTSIAPQPDNPRVTYGNAYYSALTRFDRDTGFGKNVSPWPRFMYASASNEQKYRFDWTPPIFFNPANPKELLVGSQVVFSSTDLGKTWSTISPDLTRNDPSTEGASGGPISNDQTGAETFPDLTALAASPLDADVLWAGSADGLVHVTSDHGAHWTAVTPPQLPQWAQISTIDPSHTDKGSAFLSASRYRWDDYKPYVYETTDYGAHWVTIANGLPPDQYVLVVRQDPREPRLLFAGTRSTVYASLDGGQLWQPLTLNLPGVQVRDLAIDARQGDLVAATHGRAFWILDNLALLEQLARQTSYSLAVQLFVPETAWLTQEFGAGYPTPNFGENPQYGATVFFNLPRDYDGRTRASLAFVDASGTTIRAFDLHPKRAHAKKLTDAERSKMDTTAQRAHDLADLTAVEPGTNVFQWDMKYAPGFDPPGFRNEETACGGGPYKDCNWPDASGGPTILPGTYTVALTYGAQTVRQPLTVTLDPRAHPAPGDLQARLALEKQILDAINTLDRSVADALSARVKLPAPQRAAVDREIASLVMLHMTSSEADVMYSNKIREQLGFLMNELERGYEKPTAAEYAAFAELKGIAVTGEERLAALTR